MCRHTEALHADLPSSGAAPGLARRLVRQTLCRRHAGHLSQAVQLVASELVTNAVRHGRTPIAVSLDCVFGQGVVLAVSDAGPALPRRRPAPAGAESGRGVQLIEVLCSQWGVTQAPAADGRAGTKRVWTVFDSERASLI